MLGLGLTMWRGDKSKSVMFDSASEGVVDTLLTLLANHDGVGQGGEALLHHAKRLVLGKEDDALEDIGVSSKTPKTVVMWMEQLKGSSLEREEQEYGTEETCMSNNREVKIYKKKTINTIKHEVGIEIEEPTFEVGGTESKEVESLKPCQVEDILDNDAYKIAMFWENIGVSEMSQQQKIADTKKPIPVSEENTYLSPKIICNICNKKVGHMKAHRKYNHEPKSEKDVGNRATVNYCTICQKSVCKKEVHNRKVHGHVSTLEVVPCPHCSDWFPSNEVMNEHMSFHDVARDLRSRLSRNLGTRLYCKLCRYHCFAKTGTGHKKTTGVGSGEILPRGYLVMEHHMKSHGEKHLCNKCGKEYNSERQLIEHAEACGLVFQCDQCPVDFKQKSSLECHILGEHENQYRFDCEKCDRKFSTTKSLLNHARTHNKRENKVCIECRKELGDS